MMKASTKIITKAMTGLTQGWPMGTTMSNAASHICMSVGIVFITKIYRPAYKEAMRFLRGTHARADARNSAPHTGDKCGDLQDGLSGNGGGKRGTGFSPLLAHDYKNCPRRYNLRCDTGSVYRCAYESQEHGLGFEGLLLMIGAVIAIFFFGV